MAVALLACSLVAFAVACSSKAEAPTDTPSPAEATNTPAAAKSPTVPPIDGTVAPQNAGDTVPFVIKSNPDPVSRVALLVDVRVGHHPEQGGWDRIVFEFKDVRPAGRVEYVDRSKVGSCASGELVPLKGNAALVVRFEATNAHDENGNLTVKTTVAGPGFSIIESTELCDFEAEVQWAVGTSGKQNFKLTLLENPTRVVIDVKNP
ncbi:MAG TPA: hypothetical protein VI759_04035 [Dehalococcoidia bacterium]|nr:hypothetical protein [Dehalococcoidia bacterium]